MHGYMLRIGKCIHSRESRISGFPGIELQKLMLRILWVLQVSDSIFIYRDLFHIILYSFNSIFIY